MSTANKSENRMKIRFGNFYYRNQLLCKLQLPNIKQKNSATTSGAAPMPSWCRPKVVAPRTAPNCSRQGLLAAAAL